MRIQSSRPPVVSSSTPDPARAKSSPAEAKPSASWGGGAANVARDVRAALTHPQGRATFAELLENQLGDPNAGTGYVWDPSDQAAMQWTLRSSEMGDDSLLVRVNGKELSIQSEMSGFEGKATFGGSSREALNDAIRAAVKNLETVTERNRGP